MGDQLELPGLEPPRDNDSPMVRACRQTIAALQAADKLLPQHAVLTQLLLSLSEAIDGGRRSGRASAVAMAAKELRETLLMIDPPPEDGSASEDAARALREFMAKVEAAANNGGQLPDGWVPDAH
jgi:hypothetical protein